jgi:hypothetical protein
MQRRKDECHVLCEAKRALQRETRGLCDRLPVCALDNTWVDDVYELDQNDDRIEDCHLIRIIRPAVLADIYIYIYMLLVSSTSTPADTVSSVLHARENSFDYDAAIY